jgi:Alpha-(1,6)-fucosyltransferase N- and catalytic domains
MMFIYGRVILNDLEDLSAMEGHDAWRAAESRSLSDLVQKRLHALQNPADCSKARKLICNLNKVKSSRISLMYILIFLTGFRAVGLDVRFTMLPTV